MAALEFKRVLDAVGSPDRESIWHLTGIARDNVEEAANIAKVIEADIKEVSLTHPFLTLESAHINSDTAATQARPLLCPRFNSEECGITI